jgi:membrane-associated protease RseP (regulator of RpoE activity)
MDVEPVTDRALRRCVIMFLLTLMSVYLVYGYQWSGGDPLGDWRSAKESLIFSTCLMFILLSHELGHYIVARRHGFSLSLPYFLPFPFAFGTLGAVIRLKSMPKDRNALLEMGAAGPIAGFVASICTALIGMPYTQNKKNIELPASVRESLESFSVAEEVSSATSEQVGSSLWDIIYLPFEWFLDVCTWIGLIPEMVSGVIPVTILSDPLLLKGLGILFLGEELSPYANLHPAAFACWVGCLLTAINMLPIGQLDGGHICHALFPSHAKKIGRVFIFMIAMGMFLWLGWLVWAMMLYFMGATKGLSVPKSTLSVRAKIVAFCALIAFCLSFMLRPVQLVNITLSEIHWIEESK